MTSKDRLKRWTDAGLGKLPIAQVAANLGVSKQRVHQIEKEFGTPHVWASVRYAEAPQPSDMAIIARLNGLVLAGACLGDACDKIGLSRRGLLALERRNKIKVLRGKRGFKPFFTSKQILQAVRRAPTVGDAGRLLGFKFDTRIHHYIKLYGIQAEVRKILDAKPNRGDGRRGPRK